MNLRSPLPSIENSSIKFVSSFRCAFYKYNNEVLKNCTRF